MTLMFQFRKIRYELVYIGKILKLGCFGILPQKVRKQAEKMTFDSV